MKKKHLLGSLVVTVLLIPVFVSALTVEEIQAQIQALINRVVALQAQLVNPTPGTEITTTPSSISCPNLYRALYHSIRGSDVGELQQFLLETGDYTYGEITNYFGPATEAAAQRFQCRELGICSGSSDSNGYGFVGSRTRAAIAAKCGTSQPLTCPVHSIPQCLNGTVISLGIDTKGCSLGYRCEIKILPGNSLSASPKSGAAPLTVTFSAVAAAFTSTSSYYLNYGDGTTGNLTFPPCALGGSCPGSASHTYNSAGTYTARLMQVVGTAAGGVDSGSLVKQISTVTITVAGSVTGISFSASPTSGTAPLAITFSGTVTSSGYSIDFGDGTTSGDVGCSHGGCVGNGPTSVSTTHIYTSAGTYIAKLRRHFRTNEGNCAGVDCNVVGTVTIIINAPVVTHTTNVLQDLEFKS